MPPSDDATTMVKAEAGSRSQPGGGGSAAPGLGSVHPAIAKLADAAVFKSVPPDEVRRLLGSAQVQNYPNNKVVFQRGDAADYAYIVLNGHVQISTQGQKKDARVTVEIFKAGDIFGELGVISGEKRTADANAMGTAQVATLNGMLFRTLMETSPAFSINLLQMVTGRLRRTYMLLEDAALLDLEHRLARQVLYLLKLGATGEQQPRLYARFRQKDLADLLAAVPRSIITILNKWRAQKLVHFDGRTAQLTILDLKRFKALLDD
jgi:CRP/FNR family transcriptional regulator, cyclic AMP receptor protein